jgi:plasmid stabilization system protein ParE
VARKILTSTRNLAFFPLSGRQLPEGDDKNLREIFVYSYRIIYRVEQDVVLILAVIHGKRML